MKIIESFQNPTIKKILLLQEKSKLRKEENVFVVDGWKETKMALENNFVIQTLFCSATTVNSDDFPKMEATLSSQKNKIEIIQVSDAIFEKIAYRGNTSKVVAIAQQKQVALSNISLSNNPIILVLDAVEKPGNLGALLRIADAANIDAVLCCDVATDIYNPNVIRSSVGCVFTQQIAVANKESCYQFLKSNQISIFTTSLKAAKNYLSVDYTPATAFVMGTEATGVDVFWENNADQNIIIPMRGQNDSLNVSNSAAIVLFEALRQRQL
ncbi:MAG: RNA methyltransferase [Chitinophagales bacterium]